MIITTSFVPYGGLTTVAMNYFRNIDSNTFKVDFASTNDCPKVLEEELFLSDSHYYKLPNRIKSPFSYMKELYRMCRDYDVIHIHGNSATTVLELIPAKLAGVKKRIVHIHNAKCEHVLTHRLMFPLMKFLMTKAIACSDAVGKINFNGITYKVLNNSIDLDKYCYSDIDRQQIRMKYGIDKDCLLIGHVGKFVKQKNHMFLLDVFKEIVKKNMPITLRRKTIFDLKDMSH